LAIRPEAGAVAYTDGTSIVVDPGAGFDDLRDVVVVQAALLAAGSLRKDLMARLSRHRAVVTARYQSLELARAAASLGHLFPAVTVDRIAAAPLPEPSAGSEQSLARALTKESIPDPPGWTGTVRPSRLRRVDEDDLRAAPSDRDLSQPRLEADDAAQPDDAGEESKIVNLLSAPGMSNPLGDALQRLLGMGRRGLSKNQTSGEIPVAMARFGAVGRNARRLSSTARAVTGALAVPDVAGVRYPEWDCRARRYRLDWCTVAEFDPPDGAPRPAGAQRGAALRGPLSRVGVEAERHRRQPDGDGLDQAALVDYAVRRGRGEDPDPNVYETTRLTKRDLSVLVLLDCSGSTAEHAAGHVVFEEERELAGQLTSALERLGDRVGAYGFYSRGRGAVTFLRIKDFHGRFDSAAQRRLNALQPSGFTRVGAAIRHAAHVLESQALARNMVLVVIGDGLPYDDGYEDRYARADARQAIEEAVDRGIGVVGLGIRSSTEPEVLEDVWSSAPFRVVDDVTDVRRHIRGLLNGALDATRSNGRRRMPHSEREHRLMRSVSTAAASRRNSYV
jgi:hypothetical protein